MNGKPSILKVLKANALGVGEENKNPHRGAVRCLTHSKGHYNNVYKQ